MRMYVALVLVVALAVLAGAFAFVRATPDTERRPHPSQLGFQRLDASTIRRSAGHAAAYHLDLHRTRLDRRLSRRVATAWLQQLSAGTRAGVRAAPRLQAAPVDDGARLRISELRTFADDLPASVWAPTVTASRVRADRSTAASGARARTYAVGADVELRVARGGARAGGGSLRLRLVLSPVPASAPGGTPSGWRLRDARMSGPTSGLRAYRDPVVVRVKDVDVVAPAGAGSSARLLARRAAADLARLRGRYPALAGTGPVSIWVLEAPAQAARALVARPPRTAAHQAVAGHHDEGWVASSGDVALVGGELAGMRSRASGAVLVHELAHVSTRGVRDSAPALLRHGLAAWEAAGARLDPATPSMERLQAAFARGDSGLARLLVAAPAQELSTDPAATDAAAAHATVAWIESVHGHRSLLVLLRALDAGATPSDALRRSVERSPRQVEVAVARWLRAAATREEPGPQDEAATGEQE